MISQVTDPHMPSFIATPRVLWQSFVPVWLFPIFFFVGAQLAGRERFFPAWLFWVVALSLFFFGVGCSGPLSFSFNMVFSILVAAPVRPNISFNRTRRRRALKCLAGVGGGAGPVNSIR